MVVGGHRGRRAEDAAASDNIEAGMQFNGHLGFRVAFRDKL